MTYNDYKVNYYVARARARQEKFERRKKKVTVYIAMLAVIGIVVLLVGASMPGEREYTKDIVVVNSAMDRGTLWEIARLYCPADMDVRDYIRDMKKDNNCTNIIHDGDILMVRMYEVCK